MPGTIIVGFGNALMGVLSAKYGWQGMIPISLGHTLLFAGYHLSKGNSWHIYKKNPEALKAITYIGINHFVRVLCIFMAFRFAHFANANHGVIAGIFTSGVMFTTLVFWRIYKERLTMTKLVGIGLIIFGVFCVGYKQSDTGAVKVDVDLMLAILFALGVGVMLTVSALLYRHYPQKLGISPSQV